MAMKKEYRAVDDTLQRSQKEMFRDTRGVHQMLFDFIASDTGFLYAAASAALLPILFPSSAILSLLIIIALFYWRKSKTGKERLPFRVPAVAGKTDYGDVLPGRRGYAKGSGVFYLGVDQDGNELWLKAGDMLTHMLVFGTTGSGKTVTLTAIAANYIAMGGGFIYTDPKAAPSLWRNLHIIARIFGRDFDLRVANYMTANAPKEKRGPERLTNTLNPFAFGNADQLTQLLTSLIEVSGGDNAVFGQNAMMAISALMLGLVDLRDKKVLELSISTIRDHFNPTKMIELALHEDVTPDSRESIAAFLGSMGWQPSKEPDQQPRSFGEQFQYAKAYFGLALNSLTDTYGHIYRHNAGEIDMFDIIKNRRILVNMLPALEKSPAELKQLGKVTLSSIRNAISAGLGDGAEGRVDDVTNSLPLASPVPFGVITDEYAAIPTPGFAEIMTQGRGLGISSVTASQDLDGMMGDNATDKKGAMQIVENTKVKLGMKISGAGETWTLWKGLADEATVMQTQGFSIGGPNSGAQRGMLDINYRDNQSATSTKVSRIDLRDFQEQAEGEFHAFFNGQVVRGDMFFDPVFDDPNGLKTLKVPDYNLNIVRLAYIEPADYREINARIGDLRETINKIIKRCEEGNFPSTDVVNPSFNVISNVFASAKTKNTREQVVMAAFFAWSKSGTTGNANVDALIEMQQEDDKKSKELIEDDNVGSPAESVVNVNTLPGKQFMPSLPMRKRVTEIEDEEGGDGGDGGEGGHAIDSQPKSVDKPLSDLAKNNDWMMASSVGSEDEIVEDIERSEKAMGMSEADIKESAIAEQKKLVTMTAYPTAPKPSAAAKEDLDEKMESIINDALGI